MISGGAGRNGRPGITTDGDTFFVDELTLYKEELRVSGVVHGIAFQPSVLGGVLFQYLESDGTKQITVVDDGMGHLVVHRGDVGGATLDTSMDTLTAGVSYFIESKVFIDDVDGTVEIIVWSDSSTDDTFIDFTGDTRNAGTGLISKISYGVDSNSPEAHWCDKYTCDLVGSSFNDFLGNKRVDPFYPSDVGDAATWIPTPDVPNWENVGTNPPDANIFNTSPDVSLDTIPTLDRFALQNTSATTVNAVVANIAARALPNVEVVDVSEVGTFAIDPPAAPLTTTSAETLTGNLILVVLRLASNDLVSVTPVQPDWTLLSHQRADRGDGNSNHFLVFWRLAAGDGAVEYDFSDTIGFFTFWDDPHSGDIRNVVLRNQTGSWDFDLVEASANGSGTIPPGTGDVNTLSIAATATPDTYGHINLVVGFGDFSFHIGGHPQYACTPSTGHAYVVDDNGSSGGSDTGMFVYHLRTINGVASPSLTIDFNPGTSGGVAGAMAVSFDIKPRTSPPGVGDYLLGGTTKLSGDEVSSYGVVPSDDLKIYQFPFQLAPDDGAWSATKFNALQGGYQSNLAVDVDPPPTPTLAIGSSNPATGTAITVTPNDNNGDNDGSTPFTREYNLDTSVTLTAPATSDGNAFSKWKKDGVDDAITEIVTLAMDADHQMQAVYTGTCSTGDSILLLDGSTLPPQGDGTEITSWTDDGIHAYTWVNYSGKLGPRYDTTAADNILYSFYNGGVGTVQRALRLNTPIDTDLGLPGAFTMIFALITEAGAPVGTILNVNQLDSNAGWTVRTGSFAGNFGLFFEQYGNGDGSPVGGIDTGLLYSLAAQQKQIITFICDGINVRVLVNGQEIAGREWFNDLDSSSNYSSGNASTASNAAIGSLAGGSFANPLYAQLPYFLIRDVNLSDTDRQAIESAQAAIYGITYTPGACSIACEP